MGRPVMRKLYRIPLCLLAGLAFGVAAANLHFTGYRHAMVTISRGAKPETLSFRGSGGRQVLALTVKNMQPSRNIELRMQGAEIESWYPPVFTMPFARWMSVEGGKFRGVEFGKRLPVYVAFNDNGRSRSMEIIDSTDGSLIRAITLARGDGYERHHH
jgi:hypothetical protein